MKNANRKTAAEQTLEDVQDVQRQVENARTANDLERFRCQINELTSRRSAGLRAQFTAQLTLARIHGKEMELAAQALA